MRLTEFVKLALSPAPTAKKQTFKWSCGPATMVLALEHFGYFVPEKKIIKLMGASKESGTQHSGFKQAFNAYNIPCREYNKANYEQLLQEVSNNNPVITDYYNEYGNHYVLVTNANNKGVEFIDTALDRGEYRVIPKEEFIAHWYNTFTLPATIKRGWMISSSGKEKIALQGSVYGPTGQCASLAFGDLGKPDIAPPSSIQSSKKQELHHLILAAKAQSKGGKLPDHN